MCGNNGNVNRKHAVLYDGLYEEVKCALSQRTFFEVSARLSSVLVSLLPSAFRGTASFYHSLSYLILGFRFPGKLTVGELTDAMLNMPPLSRRPWGTQDVLLCIPITNKNDV